MDLKSLKLAMLNAYSKMGIDVDENFCCEPKFDFNKYIDQLKGSDGNSVNEIRQINSSAALSMYYHTLLNPINLQFEDQVAVPLKGANKKANLDVSYNEGSAKVFVESKFLEPYYSCNEQNSESYYDMDRYPREMSNEQKKLFKELFENAQCYKYYNVSQLCRHLLALYRYSLKNINEEIIFKSIIWEPTDKFYPYINKRSYGGLKKRTSIISDESTRCQNEILDFLEQMSWGNCKFKALKYKDILDSINNDEEFMRRYFF